MTEEKNEKNGFYTFLVILSALGILAIIIAVGFAFFYPGMTDNRETPHLSVGDFSFQKSPDQPDIQAPESETGLQNDIEEITNAESTETFPSAEGVTLDNSEALIDSLMSDRDDEGEGNLNITINEREEEKPAGVNRAVEDQPAAAVRNEPRYEKVIKDVYWIQVASFPNSVKAEELRDLLKGKGIDSTIQTRNVNDTLYYRVRIGAFSTKAEADNFDLMLQDLPEIAETQIYTTRIEEKKQINS